MTARIVRAELIKVFARKMIYAFLGIQFLVGWGLPAAGISAYDGQSYPMFLHGLTASWTVPVYTAVLASDMFAAEYAAGTLSLMLVHPVTRGELLAGKALALTLLVIMLLFFTMAVGYAAGTAVHGWGSNFMYQGREYAPSDGLAVTAVSFLGSAVPLAVFGFAVIFLSFLIRNGAAVVGAAIGIMLVSALLGTAVSELQPYLLTSQFSAFSRLLALGGARGESLKALAVLAAYGLFFYASSLAVFKGMDMRN